jgi:hypothetical protein
MATTTPNPHALRQLAGAREELERAQVAVADSLAALARASEGVLLDADVLADHISRAQQRLAEAGRYTTRYALIRVGQVERQLAEAEAS